MARNATISISVHDRFMLARRLAQAPDKVSRIVNKTLLNIAIDFERAEKQTVPVITGRLQSSIWTERQDLRYTIQPNTEYAARVNQSRLYVERAFAMVEPGARQELNGMIKDIIRGI